MDQSQSTAQTPQSGESSSFLPTRSRKKRKNRPLRELTSPSVLLDRAIEELAASDWLRDSIHVVRDSLAVLSCNSPALLCLGLGSPAESRDARAQLAFLLAACDDLCIDRANVLAYDPVFTDADVELLGALRIGRLTENKCAAYAIEVPTIVFMPHCDLQLYENLLRENWSRQRLSNVVLIANRLSEYAESYPSRKLATEYPCVARLTPHLASRPIPVWPAHPTAFNNTAVQFALPPDLASARDDWWELPVHPIRQGTRDHDGDANARSVGSVH